MPRCRAASLCPPSILLKLICPLSPQSSREPMTWFDAVNAIIARDAAQRAPEPEPGRVREGPTRHRRAAPRFSGIARPPARRATFKEALASLSGGGGWVEPNEAEVTWRELDLDGDTFRRQSPAELLALLADISPDISRALWDFLRMCNPGWEADAVGADGQPLAEGPERAALMAILGRLKELYGSVDVVINRLYIGGFLRGAFYGETVLDRRGRAFVDLATPDPLGAKFKKVQDRERGRIWQLGQLVEGRWQPLTAATVKYIPPSTRPPTAPTAARSRPRRSSPASSCSACSTTSEGWSPSRATRASTWWSSWTRC